MKRRNGVRILIASLALLLIPYAPTGRVVRAVSPERFRLLDGYMIIVPVFVNGAGPFEFLLDTGTNTTLVDERLAAELALRPTERVSLETIAGVETVPLARLRSLTLAGKTLAGLEALCTDLRGVRSIDAKIRGVVGWNFLSEFNFLLDYAERRVAFADGQASEEHQPLGVKFSVEEDEGRPMVRARFSESETTPSLRLIIDSGVPRLALFGRAARMLDDERLGGVWFKVSTVAGSGGARGSLARFFQVGNKTFRDLPVVLVYDGAATGERAEDGLLPTTLFRSIYFDREKFIIFNPRMQN